MTRTTPRSKLYIGKARACYRRARSAAEQDAADALIRAGGRWELRAIEADTRETVTLLSDALAATGTAAALAQRLTPAAGRPARAERAAVAQHVAPAAKRRTG